MSDAEPTLSDIAKSVDLLAQSAAKEFNAIHKVLDVIAGDLGLIKGGMTDVSRSVQTLAGMAGDHGRRIDVIEREIGLAKEQ